MAGHVARLRRAAKQHRDVLDDHERAGVLDQAAPQQGDTANIDADISVLARQPWPRWRIQATIGTVIVTAMPSSINAGASACNSDQLVPSGPMA
jgi:hypothetical protein